MSYSRTKKNHAFRERLIKKKCKYGGVLPRVFITSWSRYSADRYDIFELAANGEENGSKPFATMVVTFYRVCLGRRYSTSDKDFQ